MYSHQVFAKSSALEEESFPSRDVDLRIRALTLNSPPAVSVRRSKLLAPAGGCPCRWVGRCGLLHCCFLLLQGSTFPPSGLSAEVGPWLVAAPITLTGTHLDLGHLA